MFEEVLDRIKEKAGEMTGKPTKTLEATTINGVKRRGICIQIGTVGRNIYFSDKELERMQDGNIEEIVKEKISMGPDESEVLTFAQKLNKEFILDKVEFRLLNRERNATYEAKCPFEKCMDLAAYYYVADGKLCARITKQIMETLGITREELKEAAEKKLAEDVPAIKSLDAWLKILDGRAETGDEDREVVVLSKEKGVYGASLMLHIPWLQAVAEYMNRQTFYVIPASVNEVICVANNRIDEKSLKRMIFVTNRSMVRDDEFLSDTLYLFDSKKCSISVCG